MTNYKLILENDYDEDFSLVAIHCSEEPFKITYLINKFMQLRLQRSKLDLNFSKEGIDVLFPLYEFEDEMCYATYHLIANKCLSLIESETTLGGLFDQQLTQETIINYLIPELKQVDFFLKIYSDFDTIPLKKILADLNDVKQIISAYTLTMNTLKSKHNLIFD